MNPVMVNRKNIGAVAPLAGQSILVNSASHTVDDTTALVGSMIETTTINTGVRPVTNNPKMRR